MTQAKDPKQRFSEHPSSWATAGDQPGDRATDWSENLEVFTVSTDFYSVPARGRPFYYVFLIIRFTKYCKNQ